MKIENKNAFDVLKERGFIKQTVYEDDLYKLLGKESTPFYVGFDPTADSLHIGHYIPTVIRIFLRYESIAGNCASF